MIAVYKAEVIGTSLLYVGCAYDYDARKARHLNELQKGIHHNAGLQRAFSRDPESVVFTVLEVLPTADNLEARERYWIRKLGPGLNRKKREKTVEQIDSQGSVVRTFRSLTAAADEIGRNPATLHEAIKLRRPCAGLYFRYKSSTSTASI